MTIYVITKETDGKLLVCGYGTTKTAAVKAASQFTRVTEDEIFDDLKCDGEDLFACWQYPREVLEFFSRNPLAISSQALPTDYKPSS